MTKFERNDKVWVVTPSNTVVECYVNKYANLIDEVINISPVQQNWIYKDYLIEFIFSTRSEALRYAIANNQKKN